MKTAILALNLSFLALSEAHATVPLPCTLMILDTTIRSRMHQVLEFTSANDVSNFFGNYPETSIANEFFANPPGGSCTQQTIKFVRFPVLAARAHIFGGNLAATLGSLSGNGQFQVSSQGYNWISSVDVLTTTTASNSINLTAAMNGINNANLPVISSFSGSLDPHSCQFAGYLSYTNLNVTSNGSCIGGPPLGSQICDAAFNGNNKGSTCTGGQLTDNQNMVYSAAFLNNDTTKNPGSRPNVETLSMFVGQGPTHLPTTTNETITSYYEVLTVDILDTGTIGVGQQIQDGDGNGVSGNTCVIWANISGSVGSGSTWLVSCANPTEVQENEMMTTTPCSMMNLAQGTVERPYLEVSANNNCPYWTTTIDYLADVPPGTVARKLKLTSATKEGFADTPGEIITNVTEGMASVMELDNNFDAYFTGLVPIRKASATNYEGGPSMPYGLLPAFLAWTQAQPNNYPYYDTDGK